MSKKTWTITVFIIVTGLLSVAIYSNYKAKNIDVVINEREKVAEETIQRSNITINTKHQYKDGVHTWVGTFETPTPCHTYDTKITSLEKYPGSDRLIEITYSEPAQDQVCEQVVTERDFRLSVEGPEGISINAKINGELVNLNIFEVNPDVDIDDFKIFSKG